MSIAIWVMATNGSIAGFDATVTALVLAGCGERAKELIDSFEAQPGNNGTLANLVEKSAGIARPGCRIPGR